jgi:hypothetical protein
MQIGPGGLEAVGHLALGPALGQHDLIPELVEPGEVAAVEADRKLAVVSWGQGIERGSGERGKRRSIRGGCRY